MLKSISDIRSYIPVGGKPTKGSGKSPGISPQTQ